MCRHIKIGRKPEPKHAGWDTRATNHFILLSAGNMPSALRIPPIEALERILGLALSTAKWKNKAPGRNGGSSEPGLRINTFSE